MAFVNIMVHAVWGTKNRFPYLKKDIRTILFDHIRQNAKTKELFIDTINGVEHHVHILPGLNADMSIAKTIQLIKGESSFWIYRQKITSATFEWANEYYAISVSPGRLESVRQYIQLQEEHHKKKTFQQECNEFLPEHDIKQFQG